MPDPAFVGEMRQVLEEVYRDRHRAPVREIYGCASRRTRLTADMLAHLNEIPEGGYTRREMVEAINRVILRRGEQDSLGLLEEPPRIEAVEDA